jgi:peptide chain release factor 3
MGLIEPENEEFSGFIFKIQANMNPAHRDRLAFLRVVSGEFKKGMTVWHSGTNKMMQVKQPQQFMADEREGVESAYPGDIIGLFDPGVYHLGDTLTEGKKFRFGKIPVFAPERFARVRPLDSMKRKQFTKGISQLSEEGAIQTFRRGENALEEFLVGVVGELQFDVLTYRLKSEYGVDLVMERLPYRYVRWVVETRRPVEDLQLTSSSGRGRDAQDQPVLFFENDWSIRLAEEKNPGLTLTDVAPRGI